MNAPAEQLADLEVFFGEATPIEARVYARLKRQGNSAEDCTLEGEVVGPRCAYANTLPASVPLRPQEAVGRQPDDSLLAEAVLADPCFWSPAAPYLYDVRVRLRRGSEAIRQTQRTLGIRRLQARGRRLLLDGENWVLRGADRTALADVSLDQWHTAATAMLVAEPDQPLCDQAAEVGVLLVAGVGIPAGDATQTIGRLNRAASVGFVVLASDNADAGQLAHRPARNLLLAWQPRSLANVAVPAWADVAIAPADDPRRLARWAADCRLPVIACRPESQHESVSAARAACDRLQRDLAGTGDFAGYIV